MGVQGVGAKRRHLPSVVSCFCPSYLVNTSFLSDADQGVLQGNTSVKLKCQKIELDGLTCYRIMLLLKRQRIGYEEN